MWWLTGELAAGNGATGSWGSAAPGGLMGDETRLAKSMWLPQAFTSNQCPLH